ncbi:MAG: Uma2 family endonuclease [Roseiflexus sp.]|nr:Uma2 family endonuclease [Roseiflexus sp.]MCS7288062.1 Uma2 family endonuclease [Roseiflexus sp.]MDW8148078.1 Uma2 family endonuclease [Roseiflexaceae bacterium]
MTTSSTVRTPTEATHSVPPLMSGDRLSRAEFERRYHAAPDTLRAELVEGVVYVTSPIRYRQHGHPHAMIIAWLGAYAAATPGVELADSATVRLDLENEVQPDALLRLEGGKSRVGEDDYLEGAPELVVEIAASSAAYDLHDKKRAYMRNGVREYLVVQMYERRIDWFVLRDAGYVALPVTDGILRSEVFPGLWLAVEAFWANDLARMLAVVQQGLATADHAAFVARLTGQAPL